MALKTSSVGHPRTNLVFGAKGHPYQLLIFNSEKTNKNTTFLLCLPGFILLSFTIVDARRGGHGGHGGGVSGGDLRLQQRVLIAQLAVCIQSLVHCSLWINYILIGLYFMVYVSLTRSQRKHLLLSFCLWYTIRLR